MKQGAGRTKAWETKQEEACVAFKEEVKHNLGEKMETNPQVNNKTFQSLCINKLSWRLRFILLCGGSKPNTFVLFLLQNKKTASLQIIDTSSQQWPGSKTQSGFNRLMPQTAGRP